MIKKLIILGALMLMVTGALAQEGELVTHTVEGGENLYRIALKYGVDIDELAQANNIADKRYIYRGQELIIPGLTVPTEAEEVVNPLVAGTPIVHVIQRGETLATIARQYNMTVEQLIQSNNITDPNTIYYGQTLNVWTTETVNEVVEEALAEVPSDVEAATVPETIVSESNITHVVQAGEHLSQISRRYGISLNILVQVNGLNNPSHIEVGQQLIIPALNEQGVVADTQLISNTAPKPTIIVGKQIIVDLSNSRIYAYENGILVKDVLVSTGLPATPTVQGEYAVYSRIRSQTMSGPGYSLPNVEWVMYFYQGYAIHGTYWHNNFGSPMSHGCVNLTNEDAKWFYEFAPMNTPVLVQQ